jgi:hypothetical protein
MTRALLAAVPLCLCCTSADPTPCAPAVECSATAIEYVCLDTELPVSARQGIRDWQTVLCDRHRFQMRLTDGAAPIPADCRYTILAALSTYPWVQTDAEGFAEVDRGVAWIVIDRVPDSLMRAVMAHEFGHLLGARADGTGIMADPLQDVCITRDNVAQVR